MQNKNTQLAGERTHEYDIEGYWELETTQPAKAAQLEARCLQLYEQVKYEQGQRKLLWKSFLEIEAQRDELLAAAERVEASSDWSNEVYGCVVSKEAMDMLIRKIAAIAKAEGKS
jgi:hypothetical protein